MLASAYRHEVGVLYVGMPVAGSVLAIVPALVPFAASVMFNCREDLTIVVGDPVIENVVVSLAAPLLVTVAKFTE